MYYLCTDNKFDKGCLKLVATHLSDFGNEVQLNKLELLFVFLTCILIASIIVRIFSWCLFKHKKFKHSFTENSDRKQLENHYLKYPLYIKKPKDSLFDLIFGNSVFFNNMDKLNAKILLKTILMVVHLSLTYVFMKLCFTSRVDFSQLEFVALLASFPTIFWHHHSVFYNKWKHCSDLVHTYLMLDKEHPVTNFSLDGIKREIDYSERLDKYTTTALQLKHAILIDMIHLEMWSHKSFYKIFNGILIERLFSIENEHLSRYLARKYAYGEMTEEELENFLRDPDTDL